MVNRSIWIIAYVVALIFAGAAGDALMHTNKEWGHILQGVELLGAFLFVRSCLGDTKWGRVLLLLLAYTFIRFALFNYAWNLIAGMPWDHNGTTDYLDQLLNKFPASGILFARVIFLTAGIGIISKEI